jgi:uridylate kinase
MAKNGTDGVYDKDPRTNPDAVRFDELSHQEVLERGLEVMDATAAALCKDNNIEIAVFDMNEPGNIRKVAAGEKIGTRIK